MRVDEAFGTCHGCQHAHRLDVDMIYVQRWLGPAIGLGPVNLLVLGLVPFGRRCYVMHEASCPVCNLRGPIDVPTIVESWSVNMDLDREQVQHIAQVMATGELRLTDRIVKHRLLPSTQLAILSVLLLVLAFVGVLVNSKNLTLAWVVLGAAFCMVLFSSWLAWSDSTRWWVRRELPNAAQEAAAVGVESRHEGDVVRLARGMGFPQRWRRLARFSQRAPVSRSSA